MNKNVISSKLHIAGVEHNYSWLGRTDGCYLRARIGKTKKAICSLILIDDKQDEAFAKYIIKKVKNETK